MIIEQEQQEQLRQILSDHTMDWWKVDGWYTNGHCYLRHYDLDVWSDQFGLIEIRTKDRKDRIFLGWIKDEIILDNILEILPAELD